MSRDLILVALSMMIWGVGEGMFFFFQPLYMQELGASPGMIGILLSLVGIVMAAAHLPAGYLTDRLGRKPMMIAAWLLGILSVAIMAAANDLTFFMAGSALYGLTAFVSSPLNSYITAARQKLSVGRTLTLTSAAFNFGAMLGPLLGGWVGENLGMKRSYLYVLVFLFASTMVIVFIRPQPIETSSHASGKSALKALLTPRFGQFLAIIFAVLLVMLVPQQLSQNFLRNERAVNLENIGILISARSLGVVVLNLVLGQFNPRWGFLLAQGALILFSLFLWLGTGMPWYLAGYMLMGGSQTAYSLSIAQGRGLINSTNMGMAYSLIAMTISIAAILAPSLAGFIYTQSPTLVFILSIAGILITIPASLLFIPIQPKEII